MYVNCALNVLSISYKIYSIDLKNVKKKSKIQFYQQEKKIKI